MAAVGRLPGGRIVRDARWGGGACSTINPAGVQRVVAGLGSVVCRRRLSAESWQPCEERAGCRPTRPPKAGRRAHRGEHVVRPVCPDSRGGLEGLVERRCGVGHPSRERVQRLPYSAGAGRVLCAGRRPKKQKRAVLCPPRASGGVAGMGFPPRWISFRKGAPRKGGSGGKTKAGETA